MMDTLSSPRQSVSSDGLSCLLEAELQSDEESDGTAAQPLEEKAGSDASASPCDTSE